MSKKNELSRRSALKLGAAATALPLVHIRTAGAAGRLAIAFWDHWVPDGNKIMQKQVDAWAQANHVEVNADFITGNGNKLLMTGVAEAQAKTGHDVMTFDSWDVHNTRGSLEPLDDVMGRLAGKYGPVSETAAYLAKSDGHWMAVPASTGTQNKPPCARMSLMKKYGLDVQAMYPNKPGKNAMQDAWTYDEFLKYATAAHADGVPFALGIGSGTTNRDGIDMVGATFWAFGAPLVDGDGTIQVKSDAVRQCLEYWEKLLKVLPDSIVSYDDAANNRALISGKTALICNPPSAWAVAKRDAPQIAEDCWTFPSPKGPHGRYIPNANYFWGLYNFSHNKTAAKELMEHLMQREQVQERDVAVSGYDLPPYAKMLDFKVWEEVGPPHGVFYNYPIRPWHDAKPSLAGAEAPPDIAVRIYQRAIHNNMLGRMKQGASIKDATDWAAQELEGFTR